MHSERTNVFRMLLQGRRIDLHHVDAIVKILPKSALGHQFSQVLMGREDQTGAQWKQACAAKPAEFTLLQNPQQLNLGRQAQLPDLIQEKGAVGCTLKVTFASTNGSCVGAFIVTEKFCFNQRFRDRATADATKGRFARSPRL